MRKKARTWNGRKTEVTGSLFCFCAARAFAQNGLPHVTEGAHQRKVKALITWIKAAGKALFKNSPSFNLHVREETRFQSLLGREQFHVAYKTIILYIVDRIARWYDWKQVMVPLSTITVPSLFCLNYPLATQHRKFPLLHCWGVIFSCCTSRLCILTSSLVRESLWLLLLASSCLWLLVKLVLLCRIKFEYESFFSIIYFFRAKWNKHIIL